MKHIVPCLQRLTKVKEAVKKLIDDIGRNDKNIGKNDKYLAIGGLESKEVWVEIEFLLTIKPVLDEFMTKFQREEPMITRTTENNNEQIVERTGLCG